MKARVFLLGMLLCLPVAMSAQDFVTRFLDGRKADANLQCVSISPKMFQQVLESEDGNRSQELLDMMAQLKSMQMLTSNVDGKVYYEEALELLEKHPERFKPFGAYGDESENSKLVVRERRGKIVELVMLANNDDLFAVIDFTGDMNEEFIRRIAETVKSKGL